MFPEGIEGRKQLKAGLLLRFVKRGDTFALAGGHHLPGNDGTRLPQEEWKQNMAEL